jgi:uncharacterized membrane protein YcaP (DUF421 family)
MEKLVGVEWRAMVTPEVALLEIVIRGTVIYLALFALLRFVLNRQAGTVGIADLLVVVLIADAAQNAMASDYTSLPDGILLVATIVFWSYALDWLGFHFPTIQRIVRPPALPLVRNGELLRRNMRQELITEGELMSQLRLQGADDLSQVKSAHMESDGRISFVMKDQNNGTTKAPEKQAS